MPSKININQHQNYERGSLLRVGSADSRTGVPRAQAPSFSWAPMGTRTPSRPKAPSALAEIEAMDAVVSDVQRPHEVLVQPV
jgi:hypothetical protein